MQSPVVEYFGQDTVERAVANYFARHGLTEDNREGLMFMAVHCEDDFFQMIEDFLEKGT